MPEDVFIKIRLGWGGGIYKKAFSQLAQQCPKKAGPSLPASPSLAQTVHKALEDACFTPTHLL